MASTNIEQPDKLHLVRIALLVAEAASPMLAAIAGDAQKMPRDRAKQALDRWSGREPPICETACRKLPMKGDLESTSDAFKRLKIQNVFLICL